MSIRVLIVDDHTVVVAGLAHLLSHYSDIQIIETSSGSNDAVTKIINLQPDIVLMDIRLEGPDGITLCERLEKMKYKGRVIILTSYDDSDYLLRAARAGVYGYLLKSASAEDLAKTIRAVHSGERRISPALSNQALEQLVKLSQAHDLSNLDLTSEDLRLLKLMADGATTQQMANEIYSSERTVKRRIENIFSKLQVTTRAQAVAEAYERGLL